MSGDGPTITEQTMIDYVNDRLDYDPVTSQWLDQQTAAAEGVREAFGVVSDDTFTLPSQRAWKALSSMWTRLIAESERDVCEHIEQRRLQPIVIVVEERRQLCMDCAENYALRLQLGSEHACPGCGEVETLTVEGDPTGALWADVFQWGHYVARLMLCFDCRQVMIYDRENLPPAIRAGVADLRSQSQ